jgi:prepilin-type processing-associated H-X9-DG protein
MALLLQFCENDDRIFGCPTDSVHFPDPNDRISYEYYSSRLSDKTFREVTQNIGSSFVLVMFDRDLTFHPASLEINRRNYLYADGHVD